MPMTPMMIQYLNTKAENPDAILFFRLGDFYEMFFEDAKLVSRELDLTLTGKDCGMSERAPMCGVPYHAVNTYLARLVEKGYKVAICEQTEDPAVAKGLVKRSVVRIVTPGTIIEPTMLEDKRANYVMTICLRKNQAGIAFCDVSTGEFFVFNIKGAQLRLADELDRISPSEILVNDIVTFAQICPGARASAYPEANFEYVFAMKAIKAHFKERADMTDMSEIKLAACAAGALITYLQNTQKVALSHILDIKIYDAEQIVALDRTALRNLELTQTARGASRKGTLLSILDRASTAMGSRLVKNWVERPLSNKLGIEMRLDAVEELVNNPIDAEKLRALLSEVYDIERLLSKIAFDTVNARDCLALKASLEILPLVKECGAGLATELLKRLIDELNPIPEIADLLRRAISPEAPISARDSGVIKNGYSDELDALRDAAINGKEYIAALEQRERNATGIKTLKIGYNRVFGYYIEITKSNYALVPQNYTRKQTLANNERYITDELKQLEQKILGSEDSAARLEIELFNDIRRQLKAALGRLQKIAEILKTIDALLSFAFVAGEYGYVRPQINEDGRYEIKNGRHPVVEESLGRDKFVPNDTRLNKDERVMIITGPNMAGKSTYMRQVALITLMAHAGSFVPAESADISLTDRVFTRIGASDDLYSGLSTFMVEMTEMATILTNATEKSLIILDEVGRGTSTFDGLSIAWAAVEHIASEKCGARALFATHYHELSELEGQLQGVVNYRVTAREQGEEVVFLRKVVPGGEDRSYGVAVAKLAGLPKAVIARARQIMARLEVDDQQKGSIGKAILDKRKNAGDRQVGMLEFKPMQLIEEIRALDVMGMTPIDALNKLFELAEKARRI